jgi:DNA-binding CsgD family transcriptional regulator
VDFGEGTTYFDDQTCDLCGIPPDGKHGPERTGNPIASITPRQREVLQLLAEERSAKEIASSLSISARTVEFHKYQMMATLGLHTTPN